MKKLKMARGTTLTFEEGCDKYLEYCRQRNLRQGTINHYKQSYTQFYKYFDPRETFLENSNNIILVLFYFLGVEHERKIVTNKFKATLAYLRYL